MKYKKFLLLPLLVFIYVFFIVDLLVNFNPGALYTTLYTTTTVPQGGGQPVGVGESVSVVVERPYFFGLIRLPVYTNYIGYIGDYHQAFFYFIVALTIIFIILEFLERRKSAKFAKKYEQPERRNTNMKGGDLIKTLAKAIGLGAVFGFVTYILSADGGVSVGIALLLMYLEFKLK